MAQKQPEPTRIEGFGFIYQPTYRDKKTGETKRQSVWWMQFKDRAGKWLKPVSTRQRTREEAYNELAKRFGARAEGKVVDTTPDRVRIGQLLDMLLQDYLDRELHTHYDLKCRIEKHIRPQFGEMRAVELTGAHLKEWVKRLKESKLANGSINRCLSNLHRALQVGAGWDPPLVHRIPKFPWQSEKESVRQGVVSPEEYRALRDALIPHARLALVIGYHVGLRRGAILNLKWDWFDWGARVIRIPYSGTATKHQPREVPIYGEMMAYLDMAFSERNAKYPSCQWVIAENGRRVRDIKTAWHAGAVRAKLQHYPLFHDLRRTALTNMEDAGIERSTAMMISGHKTEGVYLRYLIVTTKRVQSAGRTMEAWHAKQKEAATAEKETKQ